MVIKKNIIKSAIIILLSAYYSLHALTIDTTLIGDGTPGPYPLGRYFVDTSSISVSFADTALGNVPPFVYIEKVNGLLFSEPLDSGIILKLHYSTNFYGLQKTYSLYERHIIDLKDTTLQLKKSDPAYRSPFADENINISFGCPESREFGGVDNEEIIIGIPYEMALLINAEKNTEYYNNN